MEWAVFVGANWEPVEAFLKEIGYEEVLIIHSNIYPPQVENWKNRMQIQYKLADVVKTIKKLPKMGIKKINITGLPKEIALGVFLISLLKKDGFGVDLYLLNVGKRLSKINSKKFIKNLMCNRVRKKPKLREDVLHALSEGPMSIKELSSKLGREVSSVTRIIKQLKREGLVESTGRKWALNPLWGEVIRTIFSEWKMER